ncbi:recombinase family protein [Paenibacillus sp. L3-i20]|uniref:recombinase family protein n=1 Tax=Paenibacillus sp. L3-i20 TaxID=2905833 RepID=UPI001EE1415D|nr:recombinase family protein [Paenibacillus sp. L3-i20]GKU76895.1 hypothetical protein L3i20_v212920 [Paenibacillus sp. L3-i20]
MRVVIYVRVSTDMQAEEGYSLEGQIERCKAYCVSQGWEVIEVFVEEGESAKDLDRPELSRLMQAAEDGLFDILLVYKLDRLTRSVRDLHAILDRFEKLGIKFRSATEVYDTTTAMGKLFITIVAALAEWERGNLAERVRFGMETLVMDGKWHGGPVPEGFHWDGETMHLVVSEVKVMLELRQVYMAGNGFGATASSLNSRGLFRRGGKPWSAFGVEYILSNPFNAGKIKYGGKNKKGKYPSKKKEQSVDVIWADTNYPTIYTWEEYEEHTERIRRRQFYGTSKKYEYWFTGVLRCSRCGNAMFGRTRKKANGVFTIYMCSNRTQSMGCDMPLLRQNVAESLIMGYVRSIKLTYEEVAASKETIREKNESVEDQLKELQKKLNAILERKKKWQYMLAEDLISESDFRNRKREDDDIERIIRTQINETKANSIGFSAQNASLLIDLPTIWEEIDDASKKEMIQTIFEYIYVDCDVQSGKGVSGKGRSLPFQIKAVTYN